MDAEIKHLGPQTVAFMKMHGPYEQAPEGYKTLYSWVEHYGLQANGMPQAIYITVPSVTPEDEAEWELWAPIAGGAGKTEPDESGIGVKRIEPEVVASLTHEGPYSELGKAHEELQKWVTEQGYQVIGPPREIYLSDPQTSPAKTLTEIQVPVDRE